MRFSSNVRTHSQPWRSVSRSDHQAITNIDSIAPRNPAKPIEVSVNWRQKDQFHLIEPQINAQNVHVWPFESSVPVELQLLDSDGCRSVSKNRHDYFEIFVVCSGVTSFIVEDRMMPMQTGDMAIVGNTLQHSTKCPPHTQARIGALYFDPNFISGDGMAFSAEYLAPFIGQGTGFPHVVPAATGLPQTIFDLMEMIQEQMPGASMRARLAIKTYLKMVLILLVNYYASYASGLESFKQHEYAVERLHKFFEFLPGHVADPIFAPDAARMCGLGEAEFTAYLRQLTGRSFRGYLNQYRVERAQTALTETNHPISEIAQDTGFCDQSYFGAVFHKHTGMTPLAYRHRQRGVSTIHLEPRFQMRS